MGDVTMTMHDSIQIYPDAYLSYQKNQNRLDRFQGLTELSINFTAHAVSEMSEESLRAIKLPPPDWQSRSTVFGEPQAKQVKLIRGWVTYEEYAKETESGLTEVEKGA